MTEKRANSQIGEIVMVALWQCGGKEVLSAIYLYRGENACSAEKLQMGKDRSHCKHPNDICSIDFEL